VNNDVVVECNFNDDMGSSDGSDSLGGGSGRGRMEIEEAACLE